MARLLPRFLPLVALFLAAPALGGHPSVTPPDYATAAAKGPQGILEATDSIHFGYRTMEVESELSVHEGGEAPGTPGRLIRIHMWQDGPKRLIRMTYPPEVKGMGIFVKDSETMYVYVPEFDKVRLAASHARRQTFLGSDFNYDDMAMSALAPNYDASLQSETADEVTLLLKAKAGVAQAYPKLILTIDKKTLQLKRQQYFDESDRHVRTQERSEMKTFDHPEYGVQTVIKMIDHTNHDHSTTMTMSSFKADHEIPAKLFSKRTLVRGE